MPCHSGPKEEMTNDQLHQTYTECASCSHIADRILTAQMSKYMHLKLRPQVKHDQEKRSILMAHTGFIACGPSDTLDHAKQMVYLSGVQPKPFL